MNILEKSDIIEIRKEIGDGNMNDIQETKVGIAGVVVRGLDDRYGIIGKEALCDSIGRLCEKLSKDIDIDRTYIELEHIVEFNSGDLRYAIFGNGIVTFDNDTDINNIAIVKVIYNGKEFDNYVVNWEPFKIAVYRRVRGKFIKVDGRTIKKSAAYNLDKILCKDFKGTKKRVIV